jgi:transcription initiation factor TFIIH subunit 1
MSQHVPHIIDLEGNEENQGGFRSGNRKDVEMRPNARVPIVQTLNSLSEKIMANVAPSDADPAASAQAEEEVLNELALRDLRDPAEEHHLLLNAREQNRFFSNQGTTATDTQDVFASQVASDVLFDVQADLETLDDDGAGGIDLHKSIAIDNEDSDSDEEGASRPDRVGSRAARRAAQSQVLDGFARKRAELYGHDSDDATPMGIPANLAKRSFLTNATTTEFLKQFWSAFLSGDPDRAQELAYHAESLKRSVARIEAIADEAEQIRAQTIKQRKQDILDYYNRTGKRLKWKPESVRGGREAVLALLAPTLTALRKAQELYAKALKAEGITTSTEV